MKSPLSRALCMLLCAVLLLPLLPASARALTLTAVNDTLLPLSDSTMPARLGGELYIPYGVLTQLGVSVSEQDGALSLSANDEALYFVPDEGYAYDQYLNSYPSPGYNMNGTIYVPVKLCCGKFGLTYSTFSASGETVLRITNGNAQSDADFAASEASDIQTAVNAYKGVVAPPPADDGGNEVPVQPTIPEEKPAEPEIPAVEEKPAQKPAQVYLTYFGPPTENTAAVLNALRDAQRPAAFFLSTDTASWTDDTVRRIAGEGHTLALLLYADQTVAPDVLLQRLTAANQRLALVTGVTTRLVSNAAGSEQLTPAQRDAVIAAGYRLWDSTLDSGDDTQTGPRAYANTAQYFSTTSSVQVLRLRHSTATAQATDLLCAYMQRQGIPSPRLTLSDTPVNHVSEIR